MDFVKEWQSLGGWHGQCSLPWASLNKEKLTWKENTHGVLTQNKKNFKYRKS